MADDDRLLELLARALDPGDVEPPADRVAALRLQAAARQERESPAPAAPTASSPQGASTEPSPPPPPPEPIPLHRPAPAPAAFGSHRAGWVAAGLAVAAAAVVVALVAGPAVLRDRGRESTVASGSVSNTRDAVTRLRAALVTRDPLAVARADAELVRLARQLPPQERASVEAEAVQAHVEAIQFLRAHPTPEVLAAGPDRAPSPPTTGDDVAAPVATTVPRGDPSDPTTTVATSVSTTIGAPTRSVAITAVKPTLDGTFAVEFTVNGFTPDRSRKPGSYAVRFSFDDGQEPAVWDGPSPWTIRVDHAIRFQQVCAVVVDADRVEQPRSGNCVAIL